MLRLRCKSKFFVGSKTCYNVFLLKLLLRGNFLAMFDIIKYCDKMLFAICIGQLKT